MSALKAISVWRVREGIVESATPLAVSSAAWVAAWKFLQGPSAGRALAPVELLAILGAVAGLLSWAAARQNYLLGRRRPRTALAWGTGAALLLLAGLGPIVRTGFSSACADAWGGQLVDLRPMAPDDDPGIACQIGGVPANAYLPGTLLLPRWSGRLSLPLWGALAGIAACAALAFRDRRIRRTRIGERLAERLWLAPAAGVKSALGPPPVKDGRIQACGNATLWGELCGQVYSADKVFEAGEWCPRCQQVYRRAERELSFTVVSLYTADVDVLNGLERVDTVSWPVGEPMPADPRLSGQERWVILGSIALPDVLTVAQALALVHDRLPGWGAKGNDAVQAAAKLASERASRISGWLWFGRHTHRLTYARPTSRCVLAVGPNRLRDLVPESGEDLVLQLDIGLMPLEIRQGFRKTFLDANRPAEVQNSKLDLWIPVGPPHAPQPGVWVPRIEGQALRTWLSTDRSRAVQARGTTVPQPYRPAGTAPDGPAAGRLDLVRCPCGADGQEPILDLPLGASIAEWDWIELEQIQLLRQSCLVLVEAEA